MTVTIPYNIRWPALEWAKKNCPSYITNDVHQDGYFNKIDYFFGNEKDAVVFSLRWL